MHPHLLGQIADRAFAIDGHGSRRRLLLAGDDAQQGRFSRAIAPDQTDTVFGINQKRDVVEKRPSTVTDCQIIE